MSIALQVDSYQNEVTQIAEYVFGTMLGVGVTPSPEPASTAPGALTAAVHFAGEWKGAVLLQCSAEQAFEFTSRLLPGIHPSSVDVDVRDALGELANMLGGNLKSVLPTGVALSMPTVVEGTDYALHLCGGNASSEVSLASDLGVFSVTLVQLVEKTRV